MKLGDLIEFEFSPGYSDMRGASHKEVLKKNDSNEWTITSRDKDYYNQDTTVTVFSVDSSKMLDFEKFIKQKRVLFLSYRLKSNVFVTDYSPWEYNIIFESLSSKEDEIDYCISQHKRYSVFDNILLNELKQKFESLHGQIISKTIESNEHKND